MVALVTGGGGFIGSNLVDRLLADGQEVRVLDNFSSGQRGNLAHLEGEFELIEGDLRSYERVHHAVRGCEAVFHQGALPSVPRSVQDPITTNEVNVGGTLNVLLAARDEGVRRVVFASSSSIYGDLPKFIAATRDGRPPTIYGTGEQSRDFTHISNGVAANLLAAEAPKASGAVLNVATGERRTLNELVDAINRLLGTDIEPERTAPRPGDVEHSLADISRAREVLGYEPTTGFEEGLAATIEAFEAGNAMSASRA